MLHSLAVGHPISIQFGCLTLLLYGGFNDVKQLKPHSVNIFDLQSYSSSTSNCATYRRVQSQQHQFTLVGVEMCNIYR